MNTYSVNYNDIEGRLDPFFYHPAFSSLNKRLTKTTHRRLNDVVSLSNEAWNQKDIFENDFPYIEISAIDTLSGEIQDITYYKKKNAPSRAKMIVRQNDIIVSTTRPHRGGISLIDESKDGFIASTGFAILRELKTDKLTRPYLYYFLRTKFALNQMLQRSSGGNYPAITTQELKKIIIPIPSISIQNKIIETIEKAHKQREEKLKQADELLNSIDDFVRQQLGIDYQEPEEEKIYTVNSQDLENNRQDPYYHNPKFATTINQLKSGKYPIKELGNFITEIHYGASVKNDYVEDGIPLLRILNLKPNHIDLSDVVRLPKSKSKEIGNCYIYENDLLVSRSGSIGIVAVVPKEADGFAYGSFMIKFRVNEQLDNNYVSIWLNSDISKLLVQRERIGAIQGNITIPTIQSFLLPLPPVEKQKEIARKVVEKYQEVEKLKTEASELLSEAKKKVEAMILN